MLYLMCLSTFALPAHCTSHRLKLRTKSNRNSLSFLLQMDLCSLNIIQKRLHTPKNSWNNLSTDNIVWVTATKNTFCAEFIHPSFLITLYFSLHILTIYNRHNHFTSAPCMHSKPVFTSLSVTHVLCFVAYFCTLDVCAYLYRLTEKRFSSCRHYYLIS